MIFDVHSTSPRASAPKLGGKARLSGLWVDDQYIADYVRHMR